MSKILKFCADEDFFNAQFRDMTSLTTYNQDDLSINLKASFKCYKWTR